jgi:hypothetical protein
MPMWAVMICPDGQQRYIDSIWVQREKAQDRADWMVRALEGGRYIAPRVWLMELKVEDAKLVDNE